MAAPFPAPPAYVPWPAHPLPLAAMPPTVYLPQLRVPAIRGNKNFTHGVQGQQSMRHDEAWYGQARGYVAALACTNCTAAIAGQRQPGNNLPPTSGHGPFDCGVLVAGRAANRNEGYLKNACANCFYTGMHNTYTFRVNYGVAGLNNSPGNVAYRAAEVVLQAAAVQAAPAPAPGLAPGPASGPGNAVLQAQFAALMAAMYGGGFQGPGAGQLANEFGALRDDPDRPDAFGLYVRDFPFGHTLIDAPAASQLGSGLMALSRSMQAQRPDLRWPTPGELNVIATTGDVADRTRLVQEALPGENFVNSFTFNHIGATVVQYGRSQGLGLQLGIHVGNSIVFWANNGADANSTTIWVHNDGRHYQAMIHLEDEDEDGGEVSTDDDIDDVDVDVDEDEVKSDDEDRTEDEMDDAERDYWKDLPGSDEDDNDNDVVVNRVEIPNVPLASDLFEGSGASSVAQPAVSTGLERNKRALRRASRGDNEPTRRSKRQRTG